MTGGRVPLSRWVLFWSIALGGAAFDLATKAVVFERVGEPGPYSVRPVVGEILELRTSYNKGALWGWGKDFAYSSRIFAGLSIVAALGIVYWLFVRGAAEDRWLTVALGLITAGAMGNCYDRLVYGHVRDFVHFHIDSIQFDFAIFNFADNMLVAGAALLMLLALRPEENRPADPPSESAPEPAPTPSRRPDA